MVEYADKGKFDPDTMSELFSLDRGDADYVRLLKINANDGWLLKQSKAANPDGTVEWKDIKDKPAGSMMTAEQAEKLNGVSDGATKNSTDAYLIDRANGTGVQAISTVDGLSAELDKKLESVSWNDVKDKPVGSLITSDQSTKLESIESGATKNSADSFLLDRKNATGTQAIVTVDGLSAELGKKIESVDWTDIKNKPDGNFITSAQSTKLESVADGATKNSSDSYLLDRKNATGVQAIATVDGLSGALAKKLESVSWDEVTNKPNGTFITDGQSTKLDSVEVGATKNSKDSFLLDRVNHTGFQNISTVAGLEGALNAKLESVTWDQVKDKPSAFDVDVYKRIVDFNDMHEPGVYFIETNINTCKNAPQNTTNYGFLTVKVADTWIYQRIETDAVPFTTFSRVTTNSGIKWTPWQTHIMAPATQTTFGSVKQTAPIPNAHDTVDVISIVNKLLLELRASGVVGV